MSELFDESEVRKTLSVMLEPGAVFEVRALGAQLRSDRRTGTVTVSGYFDNPDDGIRELEKLASAEGFYVTMNPINPALLARCANRLKKSASGGLTKDSHVLRRLHFLIDLDPKRPSGISATDEEKEKALEKSRQVYAFLKARGWPEPIVGDSGNGYHSLYFIDLPCDDNGLLEKLLYGLAGRFDDDGVTIDRTVHNPSRITKLYGTLAAKGDNIPDRPHRLSKILVVPGRNGVVTREQLQSLADELKPAEPPPVARRAAHNSWDMEAFLAKHGAAYSKRDTLPTGETRWRLKQCPFDPDHVSPDAAVFQMPDGVLGFKCFHTSCVGKQWHDFRKHFEPDYDPDLWASASQVSVTSESRDKAASDITSLTSFDLTPYPAPLGPDAFYGLAGQFVKTILPCTEADQAALLFSFLPTFGNVIGRNAHAIADGAPHYCNLNVVLVGPTGKARKGSARWHTNRLFGCVDPEWAENCVASGLSSGEGLIDAVQDEIKKTVTNKETGQEEEKIVVPGKAEKRLLVIQTEFATALKAMEREGNTLSSVIRAAWDCEPTLRTLVKKSPGCSTGAHISIIAHVTAEELQPGLQPVEAANGFGNRFLWPPVKRSKELPEGGELPDITDLIEPLQKAVDFAKNLRQPLKRDEDARELWAKIYHDLSAGKPGLFGAITARAEAQCLRISDIYALLDCSPCVRVEHLKAALECWRFCEDGVRWSFRCGTGNKNADRILAALSAERQKGLTKWEITSNVFNRNATKHEIDEALRLLHRLGLATQKVEQTGGRPSERWFYTPQSYEVNEESGKTGDTSFSSYVSTTVSQPSPATPSKEPETSSHFVTELHLSPSHPDCQPKKGGRPARKNTPSGEPEPVPEKEPPAGSVGVPGDGIMEL